MSEEVYVDLEFLGQVDEDDYLVKVNKADLHTLVVFDKNLVVRHWDGEKPVLLQSYGDDAVRTVEDASEGNNLANLPRLRLSDIFLGTN